MKSARLVGLGLLAFLVLALLLVALPVTPLNPLNSNSAAEPTDSPKNALLPTAALNIGDLAGAQTATNQAVGTLLPDAPTRAANAEPTLTPTPVLPTEVLAVPPPTIPADSSAAFQQGIMLRRDGDYVRAATAFRSALQQDPEPALAREAQFRLGEALYLAADFTNAQPALEAVIQDNDKDSYADRAHYFLGDIFTQQQKYDAALEQLRIYRQHTRALVGVIDREIGDVLLASGDSAAAIQQYETALKDTTLTSAQKVAVLEKIADVQTSRQEYTAAAATLTQAFGLAPDDATRASVEYLLGEALYDGGQQATAITHWKHALAAYTTQDGAHQAVAKLVALGASGINELQRGVANYSVGSYDLAIQAFRRYIAATDTPGADALYYAGMAYLREGDSNGAQRNFDAVLQSYAKDKRVPDALYGKAIAQMRQGNVTAALTTLRQLLKQYPNDERTVVGFWNAAVNYDAAENYSQAAATYAEIAADFPASAYAPYALFNGGISNYFGNNYVKAKASWAAALKNYPQSQYADSAAYWLGKLAREQGDEQSAVRYFQQATTPPRSYYSWRALDALNQPAPPPSYNMADYTMDDDATSRAEMVKWIASWSGESASDQLPNAVLADGYFKRGSEYALLSRAPDARPQFAAVNERFKDNAAALYALALYYKDNNYFSLSIDAAGRLAALSGQPEAQQPHLLRELIYPTYYADLIVPYAKTHGFDPMLFFGLVRQESTFNPQSYSSAEARGLTQVIPDTGAGIANALNVQNFQQSDLFKPYISVRFGTYYFGTVLGMFNGNIYYGLMGYNGGPGNARKWEKDDLDAAVESISLSESYLYVRTVVDQYRHYNEIYRGQGQ